MNRALAFSLVSALVLVAGCGKSEPKKADDKPVNYATCIGGTKDICTTILDAKWVGTQCCFPDHMTCVDGTSKDCHLQSGGWTGSKCCFSGAATCVAGKQDDCANERGIWTGSQCCLAATFTCAAGKVDECKAASGKWTGDQCCLRGVTCAAGTADACTGSGSVWTGSQCCVGSSGDGRGASSPAP